MKDLLDWWWKRRQQKNAQFPFIIAVGAVFWGMWAYTQGATDRKIVAQFRDNGETVPGEIQSGEVGIIGRSQKNYVLKISYTTVDGRLFNKKFYVKRKYYDSVHNGGLITKPDVEVLYLRDSPSDAMIRGETPYHTEYQWLGPLVALAGVGYLGYRVKLTTASDDYDHSL
jgi:hypothetical protein